MEDYKSYDKEPFNIKQRIHYLNKIGKVRVKQEEKDILYNTEDLVNAVCTKGEIPLTEEEFNSEPYLYYSEAHLSIKKAQYAYNKLGIPKYKNMKNFKACFKMNDIFTVEIKDISKWYKIPEQEIKDFLIKAWKKHNDPMGNGYR